MQRIRLASRCFLLGFLLLLQTCLLAACGVAYRAPVSDVTGGPRYVTDGRMHRVNQGETLYSIAWMYDLDYLLLAQVNDISSPYIIKTGQMLRVDLRGETLRSRPVAVVSSPAITSSPVSSSSSTPSRTSGRTSPAPAQSAPPAASSSGQNNNSGQSNSSGPVSSWRWPAGGAVVKRFSTSGEENKGIDISGEQGDPVMAAAAGEVVYAGGGLLHYGELIILKHNSRYLSAYAHNSRLLVSEGDQVAQGQKIAELGSTGIDSNRLHFEIRDSGTPVDPMRYLPAR